MNNKRKQFIHNGQLIYEWDQNIEELNIYIKPPKIALPMYLSENKKKYGNNFQTQKFEIEIKPNHLKIGIKTEKPFIDKKLVKTCNTNESYWMIEDDELHIILTKILKADIWKGIFEGHQILNKEDEEKMKKQILLERFSEEHPGFDFSRAEVNGNVPDPRKFMGGLDYTKK